MTLPYWSAGVMPPSAWLPIAARGNSDGSVAETPRIERAVKSLDIHMGALSSRIQEIEATATRLGGFPLCGETATQCSADKVYGGSVGELEGCVAKLGDIICRLRDVSDFLNRL